MKISEHKQTFPIKSLAFSVKSVTFALQKAQKKQMNIIKTLRLNRLKWRHWLLIALLLLVTLTKMIPRWGIIYTFCVYPHIGSFLSHLSGWIPFAVGDLFIALSIAWVILYPLYHIFFRKMLVKKGIIGKGKEVRFLKKRVVFGRVAEYLLWVYVWFYLAWGLNYSQPIIYYRIGMKPAEVSQQTLRDFAYRYVDSLNALSEERRVKSNLSGERRVKSKDFNSNKDKKAFEELKERTRCEVLKGYNELAKSPIFMGINAPFNQHPHPKTMLFTPLSSMAAVTGSMGPFFCEYTLNGDVLANEYPATYAHEFAHFLGIANEGEANFYSYIICTASSDPDVRFSGYYQIIYHVLNNVYDILGVKEGDALVERLRPEVIQMAREDRRYWRSKRCKLIDSAQDVIFELYLKGNNVKEGRKSYSGVVSLILSWEELKKEKL